MSISIERSVHFIQNNIKKDNLIRKIEQHMIFYKIESYNSPSQMLKRLTQHASYHSFICN